MSLNLSSLLQKSWRPSIAMLVLVGCGQNAHLTAPTPSPNLRNSYAGNDLSNGDYAIAIGATNDTGEGFKGDEKAMVTLDSPDGRVIYFAGEFKMGMDLTQASPLKTDSRSIQKWRDVQAAISHGMLLPNGGITFDKRKWAIDQNQETYYYRLFDTSQIWKPENTRHAAVPLRLTLSIQNEFGLGHSAQVIMPVRYRYAFDDEALAAAQSNGTGGASYNFDPAVTPRVIAGLEFVSNLTTTTPDSACETAFHLPYAFDFIDMTGARNHFAATATGLRAPNGAWQPISVARPTILQAIGSSLGGSVATFTVPSDYEGLCFRKVYGFVLTDRFIDLDLSGIRLNIQDGALQGEVIYGLTKVEAF